MGGQTATTTSTSAPPQMVQDMYKYITEQGKALQQQPYQAYTGELVPGMNATQQAGLAQANQYSTAAQPYYQQAGQMTQDVYKGYSPQGYQQGVQGYMNPYLQNAVGATTAQMQNVNQQQQQQLLGNAISQGAFGGDRGNIAQAALMGQQNLALGQTISGMENQGYQNAAQNYMAGLQNQGNMANQYANLGTNVQNMGMAGAQGLMTAGAVPYAVQQAQDAAQYQQFAQQQAYPWQTLGSLANMASGLGAGQGGVSTTTSPGPSSLNSFLGLGTALLNMSDERTKDNMEPIGKTFDGQNIYKFNYKGDPKTNIGLSAQEVEKRHPDAVHKTQGGLRMVNYDDATSAAADKGHFAAGGSSMGGLVPASMERQPYAYGGIGGSQYQFGSTPYADDPLTQEMATLAKITLGSYIPHIAISGSGGGVPIPHAQPYQEPTFDTSGISGFGKAVWNKFGPTTIPNPSSADMLAAYQDVASKYSNWTPDQATFSASGGYAHGGLVPRSHHADGDTPPQDNTVPADQGFLGDLGSSISKGVGGLFSTHDQPGLAGNLFNSGKPLSDDARMALVAAGFGMAASPSPFIGQAIGQGGLIGMNTYAKQRQLDYETQKALAEQGLTGRRVAVEEAGVPIEYGKLGIAKIQAATALANAGEKLFTQTTDTDTASPTVGQTVFLGPKGEKLTPSQYADRLYGIYKESGMPEAFINSLVVSQTGAVPRQGHALGGVAGDQNSSDTFTAPSLVSSDVLGADEGDMTNAPAPVKVAQAAITDASQAPSTINKYKDVHPEGLPNVWLDKAEVQRKIAANFRMQKNAAAADAADKLADTYQSTAEKIDKGEMQTKLINGEMGIPQSILDYNAQKAAYDKYIQDMSAKQADTTHNYTNEQTKFLEELPPVQQVQEGLINAYQKIDMNRTAGFKADAIGIIKGTPALDNVLKRFGVDVDDAGFQGLEDTAAKDAIVNAFKAVAANAAGRTTNMQLKEGLMSVAEPAKAAAAKYQVITQDRSNQLRQEDMARDWIANINNPNPAQRKTQSQFIADWTGDPNHSQKVYDQKAVDQIDYFAGMSPADIKNLPYKRTETDTTSSGPSLEPWMKGRDINYSGQRKQFWERDASGKVNWLDADQERKKYQAQQGVQ